MFVSCYCKGNTLSGNPAQFAQFGLALEKVLATKQPDTEAQRLMANTRAQFRYAVAHESVY